MDYESDNNNLSKNVNAQAQKLIKDFQDHLATVKENAPEIDHRVIFEGWTIQKIAGLQVIIKELVEDNQLLRNFSNLN